MTTNDTAKQLLDAPLTAKYLACKNDLEVSPGHPLVYVPHEFATVPLIEAADLQAMARLWLMRDEILDRLRIGRVPAADYIVNLDGTPVIDLYARIREITAIAGGEDGIKGIDG